MKHAYEETFVLAFFLKTVYDVTSLHRLKLI